MIIADVSNRNQHFLDNGAADLQHLIGIGVSRFTVGLQYPDTRYYLAGNAHLLIPEILKHTPDVDVYAESQSAEYGYSHVAAFLPYIRQAWQAVEEEQFENNKGLVDAGLDFFDSILTRTRAGIYTGGWFWNNQDYAHWFGDRDSWIADYYDGSQTTQLSFPVGDWGWQCTRKQYLGDYVLPSGDKCDLSWSPDLAVVTQPPIVPVLDLPRALSLNNDTDIQALLAAIPNGRLVPQGWDADSRGRRLAVYEAKLVLV